MKDYQQKVFAPNAFTPNGDGLNDVFRAVPFEDGGLLARLTIYDRWGRKIYETSVQDEWWDGKYGGEPCPEGVYFYVLQGDLPQDREADLRGPLTLVR